MSPNARLLLYALAAVVALIVLIARFKLHPFVVLIAVSLGLGIAAGMPLGGVVKSFQDGVGAAVEYHDLVPTLDQPPHHVATHAAQPDHRQLH